MPVQICFLYWAFPVGTLSVQWQTCTAGMVYSWQYRCLDKVKVKGPLSIRSSRVRLWGCGAHLALLAEGAGVQLPGHVASMTKLLLAN